MDVGSVARGGEHYQVARPEDEARRDLAELRRDELDEAASNPVALVSSRRPLASVRPAVRIQALGHAPGASPEQVRHSIQQSTRTFATLSWGLGESLCCVQRSDGTTLQVLVASEANAEETVSRLSGAFPGVRVDLAAECGNPAESIRGRFPHAAAVLTGIPAPFDPDKPIAVSTDRLVRGMRGDPFAFVVLATPVAQELVLERLHELRDLRSRNSERIRWSRSEQTGESTGNRTVGGALILHVSQSGAARSESITSSLEGKGAFALAFETAVEQHIKRLEGALAAGAWDVCCYLFAESEHQLSRAAALIRAEFAATREPVEPFRVFRPSELGKPAESLDLFKTMHQSTEVQLTSLLTSEELSRVLALPSEEHPGLGVRPCPRFSLNDLPAPTGAGFVKLGAPLDMGSPIVGLRCGLRPDDLPSHTLVAGITGSGKSTTVRTILDQLQVPFLVIEPAKSEYRELRPGGRPIRVFTAGDECVVPFRLNPFEIPAGQNLHAHADRLAAVMNSAFPMEGPMAALVEQGVLRAYEEAGWDLDSGLHPAIPPDFEGTCPEAVPTLNNFYQALKALIEEQGYEGEYGANVRGALLTRIRSLCQGARGRMFNTRQPLEVDKLVDQPTVIELRALGNDETKAFLMGLLLTRLYQHFEHLGLSSQEKGRLRHVLVIEEAHRLFRRAPDKSGSLAATNTRHASVEVFEQIMAEVRAYGLGLVVIDQLPLRLSDGALKNTATKIVHRLSAREDAVEVGGAMSLTPEDSAHITRLRVGEALFHTTGMALPAHVAISRSQTPTRQRSDAELERDARENGYGPDSAGLPGVAALKKSLEERTPELLLDLGDRVLFSLVVGGIDHLKECFLEAADLLSEATEPHCGPRLAEALLREAIEAALRKRWYLREDPVRLGEAVKALRGVRVTTGKEPVDTDVVLGLRRVLSERGRADVVPPRLRMLDEEACDRFLLEATGHAASLVAECLSQDRVVPGVDDLARLCREDCKARLIGRPGSDFPSYLTCLFLVLADRLTTPEEEREVLRTVRGFFEHPLEAGV